MIFRYTREQLADDIEMALKRQEAITNRQLAFSFALRRQIQFVWLTLYFKMNCLMQNLWSTNVRHVAATFFCRRNETNVFVVVQFDISHTLQTVDMQIISANQIHSNRIVGARGRKMGDCQAHRTVWKNREGGFVLVESGMKYKRCTDKTNSWCLEPNNSLSENPQFVTRY